jgi:nitrogen-specific signal transduction histidine kinase
LSIVPLEVDGRILLLATVEDVTDSRALEDQLLRSQKLEAVGRLAGGIAHDFNNLVTVILGYASFLEESMESDDPMLTSIEQIASAGHRAAELTRQLLAFARRQMVQPRLLVLTDVILGLDGMLRRLLGEHVELDTRVAPELWPVSIDPGQLEQVIVNLAVNARDAMPGGGRLTMETGNVEVGADQPYNPAMVPGSYVRLAITDTGEGMSPTTQMRLFEPFFSTKELGKGTGLGLATCYGIVKQASGYIWVDSEPERGTTFEIYLPRAEGAVERRGGEPRERAEVPGGSEHILLVEDDPQVNEIAVETLRSRGYVVHTALTGEEALEVASQLDRLDLLVTDIVLPKLGGDEVASRMAGSRPGLPVIYMSGYTDSVAVRRVLSAGGSFLQKPFTPERLAMEVRAALDRRR